MKMLKQFVIWLLVAGVSHVFATECDSGNATECYKTLVHYQTFDFPLYGNDEKGLNETCDKMNNSMKCIIKYKETCRGKDECDANCTEIGNNITNFLNKDEFPQFERQLCDNSSELRKAYLEDVACIAKNDKKYAKCRQLYGARLYYYSERMETEETADLRTGDITEKDMCCYLFSYRDCLDNVTNSTCGRDAQFYITKATDLILGGKGRVCETTEPCDKHPEVDNHTDSVVTVTEKPVTEKPGENSADRINSYFANMVALLHILIMSKYIL